MRWALSLPNVCSLFYTSFNLYAAFILSELRFDRTENFAFCAVVKVQNCDEEFSQIFKHQS